MPNVLQIQKRSAEISSYAALRQRVKETLLLGQQRIEQAKVQTYWETGKLIHDYILKNKNRAEYGKEVVLRLAEDLEIGDRLLYRCIQFARQFKNLSSWTNSRTPNLSWSHFRILANVEDEKKRTLLVHRALKEEWTSADLEQEIKKITAQKRAQSGPESPSHDSRLTTPPFERLKPRQGQLYTYPLIQPDQINPGKPYVLIDLGFQIYQRLYQRGFRPGDLIESIWNEQKEDYDILKSKRGAESLYTYKALIEKIVDGDTLRVKVDLGFDTWTRQYLRLRGIDCPEIDTPEGKRAKKFVEQELANLPFITLTTSRSDKYDRYLADVFYTLQKKASVILSEAKDLIFLNNRLLEAKLAERMIG